jgi:hypothetical protein
MILTSTDTLPNGTLVKQYADLIIVDAKGRTVGVAVYLMPQTAEGFAWRAIATRNGIVFGGAGAGTSGTCPACKTAEERDAAIAKHINRVEASYWRKFPPTLERVPYTEG